MGKAILGFRTHTDAVREYSFETIEIVAHGVKAVISH
jgi:hypothetical protein